jgi:hypothetical protein
MMHVLVARAGKQVAVMMSRKPIAPARRKLLADELGVRVASSTSTATALKEEGATTFVMKSEVAGLAKQLKLALLNQTGMRVKKLSCRGKTAKPTTTSRTATTTRWSPTPERMAMGVPKFVPGVEIEPARVACACQRTPRVGRHPRDAAAEHQ